jgi:hypothetical protein
VTSSDQNQLLWLFVLALPVACVAWTITREEIFREPRECAAELCKTGPWWKRKFFYVWTCEYCFSHYVAAGFIALTGFRLLLDDWRGYVLAWFALVAIANVYMSAYTRLRVEIRKERTEADLKMAALEETRQEPIAASLDGRS